MAKVVPEDAEYAQRVYTSQQADVVETSWWRWVRGMLTDISCPRHGVATM